MWTPKSSNLSFFGASFPSRWKFNLFFWKIVFAICSSLTPSCLFWRRFQWHLSPSMFSRNSFCSREFLRSSAKINGLAKTRESRKSFRRMKSRCPSSEPCGAPLVTFNVVEVTFLTPKNCVLSCIHPLIYQQFSDKSRKWFHSWFSECLCSK